MHLPPPKSEYFRCSYLPAGSIGRRWTLGGHYAYMTRAGLRQLVQVMRADGCWSIRIYRHQPGRK